MLAAGLWFGLQHANRAMNHRLALILFLVLVVGGAIAALTVPGAWYAQLAKPAFNPPGWIFGPV